VKIAVECRLGDELSRGLMQEGSMSFCVMKHLFAFIGLVWFKC